MPAVMAAFDTDAGAAAAAPTENPPNASAPAINVAKSVGLESDMAHFLQRICNSPHEQMVMCSASGFTPMRVIFCNQLYQHRVNETDISFISRSSCSWAPYQSRKTSIVPHDFSPSIESTAPYLADYRGLSHARKSCADRGRSRLCEYLLAAEGGDVLARCLAASLVAEQTRGIRRARRTFLRGLRESNYPRDEIATFS